jgi:hypothetical protein
VAAVGLIAYALGVVIDRMADSLDAVLRIDVGPHPAPVPTMRLRLMEVDDGRSPGSSNISEVACVSLGAPCSTSRL